MFVQHERITRLFSESVRSLEIHRYSSLCSESRYLDELNRLNPLGMKGEMAEELASVIKDLWAAEHSYIYANRLRVTETNERKTKCFAFLQDLAAKRHQEFVGSGQHDAQELLNIVLDAIHEVSRRS